MLQYALLGLLQYQPMSGYDLEQFINNSIGHFWHAKLSQIYRTLKEMEEAELVTSRFEAQEEHRSKRIYTITEAGQKTFKEWQSQFATELDDTKLPSLVRMFFFGSLEREHIEAQMRIWRDLHQRQLKHYETETRPRLENALQDEHFSVEDGFFWKATLRFGELYEEMVLRWLDEISKDFDK
jgi:PadR family transcriptional regulator, regulatory protein AphA